MAGSNHNKDSENKENHRFVKVPQTKETVLRNIFFALGLALFVVGVLCCARLSFVAENRAFPVQPIIWLSLGAVLLFLVFGITRSSILLFFAIDSIVWGLITLFSSQGFIPFLYRHLWPLMLSTSGIALLSASAFKYHKVRSVFLFPSLAMVVLGGMFLPFSTHLIRMSFAEFISKTWPIFFLLVGTVMILLFFLQKNAQESFPYMDDDDELPEEDFTIEDTILHGVDRMPEDHNT